MRRTPLFADYSPREHAVFRRLDTPAKIQNFLERIPVNFETRGETLMSPRRILREHRAHCFEGALFAAAARWYHGHPPIVMDLVTTDEDQYHVIVPFHESSGWGAISKTNHAVLRWREPVYASLRELAMSYFHEYFLDNGQKTLRAYSVPLHLTRFGTAWLTSGDDLWELDTALDRTRHIRIVTPAIARKFRRADPIERVAGALTQWRPHTRRR